MTGRLLTLMQERLLFASSINNYQICTRRARRGRSVGYWIHGRVFWDKFRMNSYAASLGDYEDRIVECREDEAQAHRDDERQTSTHNDPRDLGVVRKVIQGM